MFILSWCIDQIRQLNIISRKFLMKVLRNVDVLFICSSIDEHLKLYRDLEDNDRCLVVYLGLKNVGRILSFIRRIHLSSKLNRIINFPFKEVWTNSRIPDDVRCKHIFCSSTVLRHFTSKQFNQLNKLHESGVSCDLFILDYLQGGSPIVASIKPHLNLPIWDNIYTFEPKDATMFGYKELSFCYYSKLSESTIVPISSDVYFCGGLKGGREELIYSIFKYLKQSGIKVRFDLSKYKDCKLINQQDGISFFHGWKSYDEIISKTIGTQVILEIMQEGQTGATLRYFEAVCYNKKLLTNNPHIVNYPFYNHRWMRVFNDVSEIDVDWLLNDDVVDYNYQGEFSPLRILEMYK